jgi:hypothetical protein
VTGPTPLTASDPVVIPAIPRVTDAVGTSTTSTSTADPVAQVTADDAKLTWVPLRSWAA